jgi:hypothetical protein
MVGFGRKVGLTDDDEQKIRKLIHKKEEFAEKVLSSLLETDVEKMMLLSDVSSREVNLFANLLYLNNLFADDLQYLLGSDLREYAMLLLKIRVSKNRKGRLEVVKVASAANEEKKVEVRKVKDIVGRWF